MKILEFMSGFEVENINPTAQRAVGYIVTADRSFTKGYPRVKHLAKALPEEGRHPRKD